MQDRRISVDDWRELESPTDRKVLEALADESWEFRTSHGIARDLGLFETDVAAILDRYPNFVRTAKVLSADGRVLYRLRERGEAPGEKKAELRAFAANTYG